ncbi:unnamed protein product [Spodoptera littoralis]|uniref:DUF7041 domain-containing protein n=1 Tax=Spodoptera littoralis TaxID=7109 RepID=A0A9P0IIN4_SPOLI|nr:unnamed protein product [Spodoptera littoralis]CAH1646517.1 unnamed protein product [Spodoptera littoralis]
MDNIPYPPFSGGFSALWFAQMEAAFDANLVFDEIDKYKYTIAHVPTTYLSLIQDFILNPPDVEDVYEAFKHEFIKRLTIQHVKRQPYGNEKPSEYLRKLRKIAGGRVPEDIVLNTWRNNLPENVRQILSVDNTRTTDQMCELADMVTAMSAPVPVPTPSAQETSEKAKMQARLQALEKRVGIIIQRYIGGEHMLGLAEQPPPPAQNRLPMLER